jgi:hypothetical protein
MIDQVVEKGPGLWGEIVTVAVDGDDAGILLRVVRQQAHEPSRPEVVANEIGRQPGDPEPGERCMVDCVRAVCLKVAAQRRLIPAVLGEVPVVPAGDGRQAKAIVRGEVLRRLRTAVPLQVARGRADDAAVGGKLPHNHVRIVDLLGEADRHIYVVEPARDRTVRELQRDPQLRVRLEEARQNRQQLRFAEGDRRDDP